MCILLFTIVEYNQPNLSPNLIKHCTVHGLGLAILTFVANPVCVNHRRISDLYWKLLVGVILQYNTPFLRRHTKTLYPYDLYRYHVPVLCSELVVHCECCHVVCFSYSAQLKPFGAQTDITQKTYTPPPLPSTYMYDVS